MNDTEENVDLIDEQDVNQEPVETSATHEEPVEAPEEDFQQETPQERDWRLEAMQDPRVRERFDRALFGEGEAQQAPPPDPVSQAKEQLNQLDQEMPQLDENNMTAEQVTKFMNWQQQRARAQQAVYDAELQQTRAEIQQQRARSTLEDYIQSSRQADPDFKNYEQEFRKYVRENQINPQLLENRTVVDMIRKAIGYDNLKARRKAKAPGAPPVDEAYSQQGRNARKVKAQADPLPREPDEYDHARAAFYRIPVEDLIRQEASPEHQGQGWAITGGVKFSDPEKIRRAKLDRFDRRR